MPTIKLSIGKKYKCNFISKRRKAFTLFIFIIRHNTATEVVNVSYILTDIL